MICTDWASKPTPFPLLQEGRIDVWRLSLLQEPAGQFWNRILAEDELHRAARYAFEKDRHTYTVTRGVLRTLLGQYLSLAPEAVRFVYNRFGKPALDPRQNLPQITFNVSHSQHLSLLAFGVAADLGVDIEYRKYEDMQDFVQTVLSAREMDWFRQLAPAERTFAFLRLWTHKEAIVKTIGCGLSVPMESIRIALPLTEPIQLLGGVPEIGNASEWSLCDLAAHPEYVAALAVRAREIDVQLWDWK